MSNHFPIPERHLGDKSKLVFHFNTSDSAKYMIKELNFLENIQIDERVSTNYAQYTPLGSNGSMFAYLGTKSREFEISFNITLPHIMEGTLIKPEVIDPTPNRVRSMKSFFEQNAPSSKGVFNSSKSYRKFIQSVDREHALLMAPQEGLHSTISTEVREVALIKVMFWVNLIRASCLTHAKQPYLGPPIVRLHHGILYSDIPCIVESYNITYDQSNGFDSKTMLPRVISVKLSLKEVRLRGKAYSPGEDGDYLPGWDSMFVEDAFVTLDPNIPLWADL